MPRLEKTIEAVFADRDIMPDEVPQLDLYDAVRSVLIGQQAHAGG